MGEQVIDNVILKYEVAHKQSFLSTEISEESCSNKKFIFKKHLLINILLPYHIRQLIRSSFREHCSIISDNISIENLFQVLHPSSQ